eukprot:TRINITY_DN1801_c0_g1_i1.p1 TRINITY_DN1801_c0_g1~~TRINITY_DN1801_c0_g1_i1.p1  ORF type:complete len:142 (-),score=24.21 TRINITY_DN1801_c0_g1_i1:191-616(-)
MEISFKHGKVLFINEISTSYEAMCGRSVRVIGRLMHYNFSTSLGMIEYKSEFFPVDFSLLDQFSFKENSLLQIIGEIDSTSKALKIDTHPIPSGALILKARVVRNIDGMDTALYEQAVDIRRKFEDQMHSYSFSTTTTSTS